MRPAMSRPLLAAPSKVATTLPAAGQAQSTRSSAVCGSDFAAGGDSGCAGGGGASLFGAGGGGSGLSGGAIGAGSLRCKTARFWSEYGRRIPLGSVFSPAGGAAAGGTVDGETMGGETMGGETLGGPLGSGPVAPAPSAPSGRAAIGAVAVIGLTTTPVSSGAG